MNTHIEMSKGKRKCRACKKSISKGQVCLNINGGFGASSYSCNICKKCLLVEIPKTIKMIEEEYAYPRPVPARNKR